MENLEVVRPTWLAGSAFGCLLRDKIVERVLAGDEAAFAFAHSDAASGFPAFSGAASATAKYGS
jgi:hypothetical protein